MPDFFKNISNQITEYLTKFSRKQKIQVGIIALVAILALAGLVYYLSRPQYVLYAEDITPGEMNQIVETLASNNVAYKYEDEASKLYVEASKFQDVKLMLAKAGVLSTRGFKWADAFNSSLTTTSGERDMMQQLAFENEIAEYLKALESIDEAKVKFVLPNSDNIVIKRDEEASASIILKLSREIDDEQIYGIAEWVSKLVENLSIEDIRILDTETGKLLFNGQSNKLSGNFDYIEVISMYEKKVSRALEMLLINSGGIDDANVVANLDMDFDNVEEESVEHSLPEGLKSSLPSAAYIYESTGSGTAPEGVPGTDSNEGATSYVIDNGGGSESSVSINDTKYAVNENKKRRLKTAAKINYDKSSVSVVLRKYKIYDEALLKENGELGDTSWQQFKLDKRVDVPIEVSEEMLNFVKNNAMTENVSILAFEVPVFRDEEKEPIDFKTYIPIVVIILMIALLGYAVYKNTASTEVVEIERELSVEEMLSTTSTEEEEEEDDIDFVEKSHARIQIEHFIDENPEAVAQLLRNWLNEDWD